MSSRPNLKQILAALEKYPWTKGGIFREIDDKEHFDPIGMLLREIGVTLAEIRKLNMGTTWLRFGRELRSHYGLDVVDYYLILIAGDSSASAKDMLTRVTAVLNGDMNAIAPHFRSWIDSLVTNRDKMNMESENILLKVNACQIPEFIRVLGEGETDPAIQIAKQLWSQKEKFIRWPSRSYIFWPGLKRAKAAGRNDCYRYSVQQLKAITEAGLTPRARSNDPAIYAFKIAGGERPRRADGKWEWSVHHIYDGRFPALSNQKSTHAVEHCDYFTEAAGLVAVHPVADALATEVAFFAWLLRFEAFCRFDFDPDGVFESLK